VQHITVEEVKEDDAQQNTPRVSVFDRIGAPATHTSVFDRLGATKKARKKTMFQPAKSVLSPLGSKSMSSKKGDSKRALKSIELDSSKEDKDTQSSVPSRMKRVTSLEINIEGPLKIKRRTIVLTGQSKNQAKDEDEDEKVVEHTTSYHVAVDEQSSSESEDDDLPLEQQIPSLRIAIQEGLTDEENAKLRLAELEVLDESRLEAQQRLECYQARLFKAFNKKVRPRSFKIGELVLAVRRPIITTHRTGNKFLSKWDGPYVVSEVYTNGAYKIVDEEGLRIGPINGKFLKRYYP
jgi:hypothetical protein